MQPLFKTIQPAKLLLLITRAFWKGGNSYRIQYTTVTSFILHSSSIPVRNDFILVSGTTRTYVSNKTISISIYVNYEFVYSILCQIFVLIVPNLYVSRPVFFGGIQENFLFLTVHTLLQ